MHRWFQFRLATLLWGMLVCGLTLAGLQQQAKIRALTDSLSLLGWQASETSPSGNQFHARIDDVASLDDLFLRRVVLRTAAAGRLELFQGEEDRAAATIACGRLGGGPGLVEIHLGAVAGADQAAVDQWIVMASAGTRVVLGQESKTTGEKGPLDESFEMRLVEGLHRCDERIPLGEFQGRIWSIRVQLQEAK